MTFYRDAVKFENVYEIFMLEQFTIVGSTNVQVQK